MFIQPYSSVMGMEFCHMELGRTQFSPITHGLVGSALYEHLFSWDLFQLMYQPPFPWLPQSLALPPNAQIKLASTTILGFHLPFLDYEVTECRQSLKSPCDQHQAWQLCLRSDRSTEKQKKKKLSSRFLLAWCLLPLKQYPMMGKTTNQDIFPTSTARMTLASSFWVWISQDYGYSLICFFLSF